MKTNRQAFSFVTALFVIVIMSSLAAFILNLSGKMIKSTTAQYQREQAMLLAKSYTEYAILAAMSNDRTTNCLYTISGTIGGNTAAGEGYRVRAHINYIGNSSVNGCGGRILSNTVVNADTPLNILVDVYVDYKDPDNTSGGWLTYHRRTLQKI